MTNAHSPVHSTTGPLAVPHGGHYPAGYASPQAAEAAERAAIALELSREAGRGRTGGMGAGDH